MESGESIQSVRQPVAHGLAAIELAGVRLHVATMGNAIAAAERAVVEKRRLIYGMVNIAKLVNARSDVLLRESLQEADIVLADGLPVVWLSWVAGSPLPERVAGIDLMTQLLGLAQRLKLRVFLLGAKEEVNDAVARDINTRYPHCQIVGRQHGYFCSDEEPSIAEQIRASSPDILLVGMSSPKKELFLKHWGGSMDVAVCHGVGGSFDVFAGQVKRAPQWMQCVGLEWLFRVIQEPRRLWKRYLVTNLKAVAIFAGVFAGRCFRRRNVGEDNRC